MNINCFASHIDYIKSFLHLTPVQIKKEVGDNPVYLVEYKGENEYRKFIEVPINISETYLVCCINKDDMCDFISLYVKEADAKKYFEQRVSDYDFIKKRLSLGICYLEIKELKDQVGNVCLVFY